MNNYIEEKNVNFLGWKKLHTCEGASGWGNFFIKAIRPNK
jgi:hypothetical protein